MTKKKAFSKINGREAMVLGIIIVMVALLVIFTILTILQFNHMTKRKKAEKVVLFDWLEERGLA